MFELFNKTTEVGEMKRKLALDAEKLLYQCGEGKKSEKFQHQG